MGRPLGGPSSVSFIVVCACDALCAVHHSCCTTLIGRPRLRHGALCLLQQTQWNIGSNPVASEFLRATGRSGKHVSLYDFVCHHIGIESEDDLHKPYQERTELALKKLGIDAVSRVESRK